MAKPINYQEIINTYAKKMKHNVKFVSKELAEIECPRCGAIHVMKLTSLRSNYHYAEKHNKLYGVHNQFCREYYLNICKNELGEEAAKCFHDFYRRAHERCCNPNNKDYPKYAGKFKFHDFTDFYKECIDIYKEALKTHNPHDLTIDRIDGKFGYEPGNIRFVTMVENLRNKDYVKPVKMTNMETKEVLRGVSFGDLAVKYNNISYASSLHNAFKAGRLYKRKWKIEYDETPSTIEKVP